jgi:hypothetical protein
MPPLIWAGSMGMAPERLAEPPANREERKGSFRELGPRFELMRLDSLLFTLDASSGSRDGAGCSEVTDICTAEVPQGSFKAAAALSPAHKFDICTGKMPWGSFRAAA